MKLNFAYPATGAQKLIEIEDELKVRFLYDRRMGSEVDMDPLGPEYKGYVCRISGGNDKQGFPMKQGVLAAGRVRLLMAKGTSCYRPRRNGERKRKSVHGCIVDASLSVLSLVIVKKGEAEMDGVTNKTVPRRLGPKRASGIRKLFNLTKTDDVRQYVVRRPLKPKEGKEGQKEKTKAPKIQRLITPRRLQRKRFRVALKKKRADKSKTEAAEYAKLLAQRAKEEKDKKEEAKRRRSSASKGSGSATPSISEPPKKKSGKVPAQAPEVVLAKREAPSSQAKKGAAVPVKGAPVPVKGAAVSVKGAAVAKAAAGKGQGDVKPPAKAAGGTQKAAPPAPAVKKAPEAKPAAEKPAPSKPAPKKK